MAKTDDWATTTFEGRPLPEAIFLMDANSPDGGDDMVLGPFCENCGWAFSQHGDGGRCPAKVNGMLGGRNDGTRP